MKTITKIKHLTLKEKSKKNMRSIAKLYATLGHEMRVGRFGVRFFRKLMDGKGMFVMGDISGVLTSFSHLQDIQQIQRRRFAGSSWGKYKVRPPLQRFLRYHRLVPPSTFIQKTLSDSFTFGDLETALPPSIELLWETGTHF